MQGFGFLGTYDATIDDKGRIRLPAKFRALLGESFIIAQGAENCLSVYPAETWDKLTGQVAGLDSLDIEVMEFRRSLFSTANEGSFDAAGRVLIPQRQRNYADLKKELIAIGNFDCFEIWDKDNWEQKDYTSLEKRRSLQKGLKAQEDGRSN